jgi:hypothetical protein
MTETPNARDLSAGRLETAALDLVANVSHLRDAVDVARGLKEDLLRLQQYSGRSRNWVKGVAFGLVFDLIVSLLGAGLFLHQRDLTDQVRRSQRALAAASAADCRFFYDFGTIALPATSGKVALQIVADSRNAYATRGCTGKSGRLPRPDPRLLPYLVPAAK